MEGKDIAIVIAALGTAGIPIVLIMFTVGGIFAGFVIWQVLGFLSQWMVLLIFLGAGVIGLIELAPRGPKMAALGVLVLLFSVFFGYILWSGAFNGPTNTYALFESTIPGSSSSSASSGGQQYSSTSTAQYLASSMIFGIALILGLGMTGYAIMKIIRG
jgi:hypothetical protein